MGRDRTFDWIFKALALGLAFSGLLLSGCGEPGTPPVNQVARGRTLRVACFGGDYGHQARLLLGNLIEATTGASVEYHLGTSRLFLKELRKNPGNPAFDIVYLDGAVQNLAVREGLLERIQDKELRFLEDLSSNSIVNKGFGPGFQFFSVGLAYNHNLFRRQGLPPPQEWEDLWDLSSALRGKIGIPDIVHTAGMDLFLVALRLEGFSLGKPGAIDAAIQKVKELKPALVYRSSIDSAEKLASGELALLPTYNSRAFGEELSGAPVDWVIPKDKGFGHVTTISITKGCKNRDLALAYINAAVSPAVQLAQSLNSPLGPSNTLTFEILGQHPELVKRFPLGPADMAELETPDWTLVNQYREEIETKWRKAFPLP
jgi:putative spermidine/putrescine transport system substrate-binding protein